MYLITTVPGNIDFLDEAHLDEKKTFCSYLHNHVMLQRNLGFCLFSLEFRF